MQMQCTRSADAVQMQHLHEVLGDVTQRDRTLAQLVVRRIVDAVGAEACWRGAVAILLHVPEAGQMSFVVLGRVRADEHGATHGNRCDNGVVYHLNTQGPGPGSRRAALNQRGGAMQVTYWSAPTDRRAAMHLL